MPVHLTGAWSSNFILFFFLISLMFQADVLMYSSDIQYHGGGNLVSKSCLTLATPRIVACQASLSMGFSRQEYWSGLSFPPLRGLLDPGIEPRSPALQMDSCIAEEFL